MNKLIVVLGPPSGGTSCVSGVLYHLGVDMGRIHKDVSQARGYKVYEDADENRYKMDRNPGKHPINDYIFDLKGYLDFRDKSSIGIRGVKFSPANVFPHRNNKELMDRMKFLVVRRPLEKVVIAEVNRQKKKREISGSHDDFMYYIKRAGYAAQVFYGLQEILTCTSSYLEVHFEDLVNYPKYTISHICDWLGIDPDVDKLTEAEEFVKPEMTLSSGLE